MVIPGAPNGFTARGRH